MSTSRTFWGRQLCQLSGFPYPTLSNWVLTGRIKPVRRGHQGRGGNHLFSARHLLALTVLAAVRDVGTHSCPCCGEKWIKQCEEMNDSDVRNFIGGRGPCLTGISDETAEEMAEQIESQGGFKEPSNEGSRLDEEVSRRLQTVGPVVLAALDEQEPEPDFGDGAGAGHGTDAKAGTDAGTDAGASASASAGAVSSVRRWGTAGAKTAK